MRRKELKHYLHLRHEHISPGVTKTPSLHWVFGGVVANSAKEVPDDLQQDNQENEASDPYTSLPSGGRDRTEMNLHQGKYQATVMT